MLLEGIEGDIEVLHANTRTGMQTHAHLADGEVVARMRFWQPVCRAQLERAKPSKGLI
jgi:hypothetical protein